jgi:hypothetical protein
MAFANSTSWRGTADLATANLSAGTLLIFGLCWIEADLRAALNGRLNGCARGRRIVARALAHPEIGGIFPHTHDGVHEVDVVAEHGVVVLVLHVVAHIRALERHRRNGGVVVLKLDVATAFIVAVFINERRNTWFSLTRWKGEEFVIL